MSRSGETTQQVRSTFEGAVEAGAERLQRSWSGVLATGSVGGFDVGFGVLGLLVVLHLTDSLLLASATFAIGFVMVVLARSELFTENFLVPIAAVVAREEGVGALARLWAATLVTNLAAGFVFAFIVASGFATIHEPAVEISKHYFELGIGWSSFSVAMVAGALVTLMTWMVEATPSQGAKIVAGFMTGYLLAVGKILHCIVAAIELFISLFGGAPFGWASALAMIGWAVLGNAFGGVLLVTVLRLIQVPGVEEEG